MELLWGLIEETDVKHMGGRHISEIKVSSHYYYW